MRFWISLAFLCLSASLARAQTYSSGVPLAVTVPSVTVTGTINAAQSGNWNMRLQDGSGSAVNKGQTTMSGSLPVVLPSDQSAIPASQSGNWSVRLQDGSGSAVNKGQAASSGSLPVVLASDQSVVSVTSTGKFGGTFARNSYASSSVGTGAYVTLSSSFGPCTEIEIFDSSGQTLNFATGGGGSEVDQLQVVPGGNGRVPLKINAGTRVSLKALSATASQGEIDVNCFN